MTYRIEILDSNGCCRAAVDSTPLFEVSAHAPGGRVIARGLLPADIPGLEGLAPGWRVRCIVDDVVMGEATIDRVNEQWSDMRKLVLDRYVPFHRICEIEADSRPGSESAWVSGTYENLSISAILRDLVQRAAGKVYCTIEHSGYPAGAQREYQKFLARKSESNELQVGGIASGDWVGPDRIDATQASARDGDTISGLIVDGVAWPDVRLLMIDAEEMTRNTHAIRWHPEVAGWSAAHYLESPYRLRAVRARDALQAMITSGSIQYLELSPHRGASGLYDNRVDAYGRVLALAYGGAQCYNASLVELGLADVYLYDEGRLNPPEWALKDYFSYAATDVPDSVGECDRVVRSFDFEGTLGEALTQLAYLQGGLTWSVAPSGRLSVAPASAPDHVLFHDPLASGISLGVETAGMLNTLRIEGAPFSGAPTVYAEDPASAEMYGERAASVQVYALSDATDMDALGAGLLADLAVPSQRGRAEIFHGNALLLPGMQLEVRGVGAAVRARIESVTHLMRGCHVVTRTEIGPPLRSVSDPSAYMVRSQSSPESYYALRLDHGRAGLDAEFHLL